MSKSIANNKPSARIIETYRDRKPLLERLCTIVHGLISSALTSHSIQLLQIQSRIKEISSVQEKVERKGYDNDPFEMTDLVGVRVVLFFEKDILAVEGIIRKFFQIDEKNSIDKSFTKGVDQVGYRSSHLICSLGKERQLLPECLGLIDIPFEVQIRTALQHAWAEIEHKQNYKAKRALPANLMRRLNLAAGMLEVVDQEFSRIMIEAEQYTHEVDATIDERGKESLNAILFEKVVGVMIERLNFKNDILHESFPDTIELALEELDRYGVNSVKAFFDLFSRVDHQEIKKVVEARKDIRAVGFARILMYADDFRKYLNNVFRSSYTLLSREGLELIKSTNDISDLEVLISKFNIELQEG